jgi:hypothetical protein
MPHQAQLISDLNGDDDLGCVLRGHIHIENSIDIFLKKTFQKQKYLDKADLTYHQKVSLALSVGLHEDLASPLQHVGNLRNKFAHNLGIKLGKQEADNFYKSFTGSVKDYINQTINRVNKLNPDIQSQLKDMSPKDKVAILIISLEASLFVINGGTINET